MLEDLLDESSRYPPTPEGENRARFERLARRLTEDPVLLLEDLEEAERNYFVGQRTRVERAVAGATGYQVERRAEGSALIVTGRSPTLRSRPTRPSSRSRCCCVTCSLRPRRGDAQRRGTARRRPRPRRQHGTHWGRDCGDPVGVERGDREPPRRC